MIDILEFTIDDDGLHWEGLPLEIVPLLRELGEIIITEWCG